MSELLEKFNALREQRDALHQQHKRLPFGLTTDTLLSPTEGLIEGQRVIFAGTNNYLGLTFEPESINAAQQALAEAGTGTTGSRMANGTYHDHQALERELADFYGCDQAIVFSTGYQANLGIISTLAGQGDVLMLDADSHASIWDGSRLSQAEVLRFRHNDAADLDRRLKRLGERARRTLVVVEGLYSMLGDSAPLAEIVEVKNRYGATLLLDEAHSLGVLGHQGRGLAEACDLEDEVDFILGTFSKSLGGIGGFCVSRRADLDLIRFAIRSYVFTASPSPATVAATRCTLRHLRDRPELRHKLWANAERLYHGLQSHGFQLGPQPGPVVAVLCDDREQASHRWQHLLEAGIYVNLVLPPGAPSGLSLLRCSVSAAHSSEQIDRIVDAFAQLN